MTEPKLPRKRQQNGRPLIGPFKPSPRRFASSSSCVQHTKLLPASVWRPKSAAAEQLHAAREALARADADAAYWMEQYRRCVENARAWVEAARADERDSAPRYRLLQQTLQDTDSTTPSAAPRTRGRK